MLPRSAGRERGEAKDRRCKYLQSALAPQTVRRSRIVEDTWAAKAVVMENLGRRRDYSFEIYSESGVTRSDDYIVGRANVCRLMFCTLRGPLAARAEHELFFRHKGPLDVSSGTSA